MKSNLVVPDSIGEKEIPVNRGVFRKLFINDIKYFGDIDVEFLRYIYKTKDRKLFLDLMSVLKMYGFRFSGKLSNFNTVYLLDDLFLCLTSDKKSIKYENLPKQVSNKLKNMGIKYSSDLVGLNYNILKKVIFNNYTIIQVDSFLEKYSLSVVPIKVLFSDNNTKNNSDELHNNCIELVTKNYKYRGKVLFKATKENMKKLGINKSRFLRTVKNYRDFFEVSSTTFINLNILENKLKNKIKKNIEMSYNEFESLILEIICRKSIKNESLNDFIEKSDKIILKGSLVKTKFDFNTESTDDNESSIKKLIRTSPSLDSLESKLLDKGLSKSQVKLLFDNYWDEIVNKDLISSDNLFSFKLGLLVNKLSVVNNYNLEIIIKKILNYHNKGLMISELKEIISVTNYEVTTNEIEGIVEVSSSIVRCGYYNYTLKKNIDNKEVFPFYASFSKAYDYFSAELLQCMSKRNSKIIQMRMKGNTLESIGNTVDITRERVRQICSKYQKSMSFKYLKKFFLQYFSLIFKNYRIVSINDTKEIIEEIFDGFELEEIIEFFNNLYEKKYITRNGFLLEEDNCEIDSIIDRVISVEQNIKIVSKIVDRMNILNINQVENYLIKVKNHMVLDNKIILVDSNTKYKELEVFIKNKYPNGVKLFNEENLSKIKKELSKLSEKNDYRNDSNHNIRSKIQNNKDFIRCAPGKFVHIDNIEIKKTDLDFLVPIIKDMFYLEKLPEIWARKLLIDYSDKMNELEISNQDYLYDLLKYFFSEDFNFIHSPRILPVETIDKSNNNYDDVISEYIYKYGDEGIKTNDLFNYFTEKLGWEKYTIEQHSSNINDIIRTSKDRLANIEFFDIKYSLLDKILVNIKEHLKNNKALSKDKLFKDNIAFAKVAGAINKHMLFSIMKNRYSDEINFEIKHIYKLDETFNITKELDRYVKTQSVNEPLLLDILYEHFKHLGISKAQVYSAMYKNKKILTYYHNISVIHYDNLSIDAEIKFQIEKKIEEEFNKQEEYVSIITSNLKNKFPELKTSISWTNELISDYIEYYLSDYNLIGIASIGSKKNIIVKSEISEKIFIHDLIKKKYGSTVEKKELINFLNRIGFMSGDKIPIRLVDKSLYKIHKRIIVLNEGQNYA